MDPQFNGSSIFEVGEAFDFNASAGELIRNGCCVIKMPVSLQTHFWGAIDCYPEIIDATKRGFSFPFKTDGFMPLGMERANSTNQIDLCERYCYWHGNRIDHSQFEFHRDAFYGMVSNFESEIYEIAQNLLNSVFSFFGSEEAIGIRDSSYVQFCHYKQQFRSSGREYLQDIHEDGHLITFIKGNRDGLVIFPHGRRTLVRLLDDEMIVITGSLMTLISDERIPFMNHAVLNPPAPVARSSMVYFAIPNLKKSYKSLVQKNSMSLEIVANKNHLSFGNSPLTSAV